MLMNNDSVRIIGFDLGHGEIALAKVQSNNNDQEPPKPMLLHGQKHQPAATAYNRSQGTLFGKNAFLDGNIEFEIAFKKKPTFADDHSQKLKYFVKAIYRHLIQTDQIDEQHNNNFFIGCPSGWNDEEVAAYEKLLSSCLPPVNVVKVVRESRAALMHAKESELLTVGELLDSVLVIDIGSSTTDLTLIKNRDSTPIDSGVELGASLIDKAILDYSLARNPHKQQIQEYFQQINAYRHRCEFRCREAKEEYFSFEKGYQEKMVNKGYEKFQQTGIIFEPQINKSIMEEILHQKLPSLGKSWVICFRDLLIKTKKQLENENIQVSAVFLTGGASKMGFTSEIVKEVFPDSRFQPDGEPELCVAFGLARWGRISLRTQNFIKEVIQIIDQELEDLVKREFPNLKDAVSQILTDGLLNEVIKPCIQIWRKGDIRTLNDLQPEMQNRALKWLEKPEVKKEIEEKSIIWMNKVQETLGTKINSICIEYKLPSGNIQLEPITSWTATQGVQDIMNKDKLTPTVDFLTGTLLPIVVGILPALFFGSIGLLIGITASIGMRFWGRGITKEFISNLDIPGWIREIILTDIKVDEIIQNNRSDLNKGIKDMFNEQQRDLIKQYVKHMNKQIKAGIKKQADKANFLIA
jgi:molecular chaperone DnaK (HSP70)